MGARSAVLLCLALGACQARGASGSGADADAEVGAPTDASEDAAPGDGRRPIDGRCEAEGAYPIGPDGVCVCQPTTPNDCGSGCVDLQTDDANCGSCGHACDPTSTCRAGTCGSAVTTVVAAAPGCGQIAIALVPGGLYWADRDHGTISRMALPGGTTTTLITSEAKPDLLTVSGSTLFWIDVVSATPVDGSVPLQWTTTAKLRVLTPDGHPADLAQEVNQAGGILGLAVSADGSRVYYSAGTSVRVVPSGGGAAVDVVSAKNGAPAALALEGSSLVYATSDHANIELATVDPGAMATCTPPADGTSPSCRELVDGQGGLFSRGVLFSGGRVIWATGDALLTILVSEPTYKSIAYFASTITALAAAGDQVVVGIAGERGPGPGEILAVAAAPDAIPTRLARDQAAVSIAADATDVYWATSDCRINRAPR